MLHLLHTILQGNVSLYKWIVVEMERKGNWIPGQSELNALKLSQDVLELYAFVRQNVALTIISNCTIH